MGDGKFFEIRSQLSGLVLTVDDDLASVGQRVNLQRSSQRRGQLWYEDDNSGRIRSFLNDDLVLELQDDHLIVNEYHMDEYNQNWKLAGQVIRHGEDSDNVLDVAHGNRGEHADVVMWAYHGHSNQLWEFDHQPPRYFFIKSMMNEKVVDIDRSSPDPGTEILMWSANEGYTSNQMWWEDKYGNIRSKLNDCTFHAAEPGDRLYMQEYDPELVDGLWAKSGKKIYNKGNPDLVLDIIASDGDNGARLSKWPYSGTDNQHWELAYVR